MRTPALRLSLVLAAGVVAAAALATATPSSARSKEWTLCADEGVWCEIGQPVKVRYGANGKYVYRTLSTGFMCSKKLFGDPLPGAVKTCDIFV